MQIVGYPDLDSHRAGHRKLEAQVETLARSWRNQPSPDTRHELQHFLREWWRSHILARDISIAENSGGKRQKIREALIARELDMPPFGF